MMLSTMMITLSFIFMWLKHPLTMGITIILQTMTIALMSGMMLGSFWFSYILMITMLSGMLVLFIYMASVASNEKFYSSMKLITSSLMMIILVYMIQTMLMNSDTDNMKIMSNMNNEWLSLNNLFNMKYKFITIMMVLYLFLTMITVSMIVNILEGPLRINK
uniref:NADH-ubiquinone oxidoreductase chain 6 n=1 Tax=Dicranocephalus alticolus TaxID=1589675 RepID=A0A8T9ZYB9_9HEMI|nr:NADH dehydrogenase subunit 6 [Dicranocephalus alticolus]